MDVDTLNALVSSAIWRAEQLEDLGWEMASSAWMEVSKLEEELAKVIPAKEAEGRIARRGAVRAALKAKNFLRAHELVELYAQDGDNTLCHELRELLKADAKGLSELFPFAAKYHKIGELQRLANQFLQRGPFALAA